MTEDGAPPLPADVAAAFDAFPPAVRRRLLAVRRLVFATAARLDGVGPVSETLKWGEPAYLTAATGSGSTIRLGRAATPQTPCAVLFNCRTSLVQTFRTQFPDTFAFDKNRALLLCASGPLPAAPLSSCLARALIYHRRPLHAGP